MERYELGELHRRRRKQTVKLMEVADLTKQLAQAVDRNDEVSVKMLLSMRQEPVLQLHEMEMALREYLLGLPEESAIRLNELLNGAPAQTPEENPLCEQTAQYRRLLKSTLAADKLLNTRLCGNQSFYSKFR